MTENMAARGEGLAGLVDWLREQSEELMKSAIARESTAETMRAATPQELRSAKALAEKMAGRKLPNVSTGSEEAKIEADVQCRIAAKLDSKARQIAIWADELAATRKTLQFYADPQTYGLHGGGVERILNDSGKRARTALEAAAPPSTAPPELLCINCGHSYAQHTKGINHPQKYCRHCPCLEWTALETPDHKPAWEEMNRVRDRAEKVLGAEYLGWNWVHALVDKLEKIEACTCTDEIRHVHCPVHGDSFLPQPITALATPSPQAPAEQRYENALRDVLGLAEAAWNNGMGFGEAKTIAQICTGALSTPSAYIAAPSKLPQSFDARDWAKEFTEICATKGIAIDQDWMETWFANAIMAGYDHARAATQEHIPERGMEEKMSNWDFKRREGLYLKFSEPMAEPHTPVIIERVNGDCWVSTFLIARDEAHELINQLCEFLRVGSPRKVGEDGGEQK